MCFQFGVQFENLFKLVCQGGTADCLLYRTHVGRFDTTCAGTGAEQKTSDNRRLYPPTHEDARKERERGERKNERGVTDGK